ncbi:hypothetical protein OK348_03075 [Flavobacterium sp. MXW15]|uniref:DUF4124 domain-containing protein n=1 Tax=Xanthomonas chitinilytica TaxID=2989819 RepID=A0ABT3JRQ0_9XANT|nr:hypothetical protein [Xanthomonas sp. H13-6]MCW4453779.1 hypothetical protein [Flavobacterium sp. MXW15]MCW4471173.1 hypothetical protein [Xanthomonas sp. H13-6]
MKRKLLVLAVCGLAGDAWAQRVYKCVNGTETIYQSLPCPAEQDTGITRKVVSDPRLSYEERYRNELMLRQARARMQADAGRGQPAIRGSVIDGSADPERCEDARWRRDLAKTFGRPETASLEKSVHEACRP